MSTPLLDPARARILPWLVATAFFMETLDATIVNTALPAMAKSLGANPLQMEAVVISYLLTVALLIPASGWITDRFGVRPVFLFAIGLFSCGSLLCALSPSLPFLVGSRIIQGLGGALMVPVGRLSILKAYPRSELVQVLSFITVPALIGPLLGPSLGGFLVDYASWHWIFLINLPVGLIGALATLRFMPELPIPEKPSPFDRVGFFLFGLFMVSATMAFEGIGELHLSYTPMALLFLFGLCCLVVYCLRARHDDNPLFSLDLFRIRNFSVGIFGNLFARLGNGAMPFLTPLLLQVGLGFSPLKAGLSLIPMTLAAMLVKRMIRPLLQLLGYRWLLFCNTLALGALIAAFSFIDKDTPYPSILALFTIFGMVNSLQFTTMNTLTLLDLPDSMASSGNSLLSVVMQVAMGMGIACAAAILWEFSGKAVTPGSPELLQAFHKTYYCLGAIAVMSSAIFLQARHTDGSAKHAPEAEEPKQHHQ